ncbi:hypothetical protein EA472_06685 [Natrarchaeobius oligotrophus]|uniref:Uncharacterized protein n=1 Tax=Natrarchaeobius chitinivorans TaxID=1679083 RepID=A0A3N6MG72_NATCH|nr:hypothetical protein EA472_06685 [Natrarchaeobius chitinivorans]
MKRVSGIGRLRSNWRRACAQRGHNGGSRRGPVTDRRPRNESERVARRVDDFHAETERRGRR